MGDGVGEVGEEKVDSVGAGYGDELIWSSRERASGKVEICESDDSGEDGYENSEAENGVATAFTDDEMDSGW